MNIEIDDKVFDIFPSLESERLNYRDFLKEDAHELFLLKSDKVVMKHMDSFPFQSIRDAEKSIQKNQNLYHEKKGILWAIIEKSSNQMIGYFGYWRLIREHCRGEIGYALNPKVWGKGYMKETLDCLIPFGFNEMKLHSIEANLNPNNANSERLLQRFGFKKEAYFRENYLFNGKFNDSVIYSLLESDLK